MEPDEYDSLQREYSRIASRYETRWNSYIKASVRRTLPHLDLSRGYRVLDVGCGTGVLLAELDHAYSRLQLAGVDLSLEMLEIARQRLGADVDLKHASAEKLPFADEEFDIIVSANMFHFIRNPHEALLEMRRVLRHGGQIVITDWCDDYLTCRICDLFLRIFNRAHYQTYGANECSNLLAEADFENISIERYKISWLWGMMTATADKQQGRGELPEK